MREWLDQIRIFGFHLTCLDVRQDSRVHGPVMAEILAQAGLCDNFAERSPDEQAQLLAETLGVDVKLDEESLSEAAQETLRLFRLLRRAAKSYGASALGGHVISMTRNAADILTVLWLWRMPTTDLAAEESTDSGPLPIMPLFETIDDLERAPQILRSLFGFPAYREHLAAMGDRQTVMIGYSDSTKDGGYLTACWSLYHCQTTLRELAAEAGIELTFFHGRGGSLGRGGGPTTSSILSLPPGSVDGALRLTEQGEVLADKYDDPAIAHRHLELVMWSALIVSGSPPATAAPSGARRCRRFRRGRSRPIASFSTNRASSTFFAV